MTSVRSKNSATDANKKNKSKKDKPRLSMRNKTEEPLHLPQKADEAEYESSQTTFRKNKVLLITSDDDDDNISEDLNALLNRFQRSPDKSLPNTTEKIKDLLEKLSFPEKVSRIELILPKADPNYLKMQVTKFENNPVKLNLFVRNALKNHDYPQRLTGSPTQPQLKTSCSDGNTFIGLSKMFSKNQSNSLETETSKKKKQKRYDDDIDLDVLFNRPPKNLSAPPRIFPKSNINKITPRNFGLEQVLSKSNPVDLDQELSSLPKKNQELYTTEFNVNKINEFVKTHTKDQLQIAKAKENELIQTCNCCYKEGILLEDMFQCEADCWFCKECIKTSVELSKSRKCLNYCQAEFNFHTLEQCLPAKLFSKIFNQKQKKEYEVFEESSIEQNENVIARIYVENKMSEAVIRECHKCRLKFVKSTGCNTIACPCGAQICYLCSDPVTDLFSHRQCQRYSVIKSDEERVMKAAREAKKEVLGSLKIDPTADIKTYFDNLRKINLELKRNAEAGNLLDTSNANVLQIKPAEVAPKSSKRKKRDTAANFAPRRSKRLAERLKFDK